MCAMLESNEVDSTLQNKQSSELKGLAGLGGSSFLWVFKRRELGAGFSSGETVNLALLV